MKVNIVKKAEVNVILEAEGERDKVINVLELMRESTNNAIKITYKDRKITSKWVEKFYHLQTYEINIKYGRDEMYEIVYRYLDHTEGSLDFYRIIRKIKVSNLKDQYTWNDLRSICIGG